MRGRLDEGAGELPSKGSPWKATSAVAVNELQFAVEEHSIRAGWRGKTRRACGDMQERSLYTHGGSGCIRLPLVMT